MKINGKNLDLTLANQCKTATDLRDVLSPSTITRIRKGHDVGTRTVGKISRALNVTPEYLTEGV